MLTLRPTGSTHRPIAAPLLVLVLCLIATVAVTAIYRVTADEKDLDRFHHEADLARNLIVDRFAAQRTILRGAAALFTIHPDLSVADFHTYVRRLRLAQYYPGTLGVGFTRRLHPAEVPEVEATMRASGLPDFAIYPNHPRDEVHAILRLEPQNERNRVALGYDMFTEPVRRAAMELARDTGSPAITGPVTLVQEIDANKQVGFLIYLPVYRAGPDGEQPTTVEQRRQALLGFAYSPLRADDFYQGIFEREQQRMLDVTVFDGDPADGAAPVMHASSSDPAGARTPRFCTDVVIDTDNRLRTMRFASRVPLERASGRPLEPFILLCGLFTSLLLTTLTWKQTRLRAAAERNAGLLATAEARFRATLGSVADGVIATDVTGRINFLNAVAEQLTGCPAASAVGRPAADVFRVVDARTRTPLADPVAGALDNRGVPAGNDQLLLLREDGTPVPIDLSSAPIRATPTAPITGVVLTFRDITERQRTYAALREGEAKYRELIEQVQDHAIFRVDLEGRATTWNQGVERLLGYDEDGFRSLPETAIYTAEDIARGVPRQERHEAIHSGHCNSERWMLRRSGERFWATSSTTALYGEDGRVIGFTRLMRDRTLPRRIEQERDALLASERAARAQLERAGRMKDEFVATLSHELRTPLNAIIGWVEVLRRSPTADPTTGLATIERNARAQAQMIEDLLDLSRIAAGKVSLDLQAVDLRTVVSQALQSLLPNATTKGVRLEIDLAEVPCMVRGDAGRLQQVVWNLVANAVKFTPQGGEVRVGITGDDTWATIEVRDSGKGIRPEHLSTIFERFRQEDSSITRRFGGLGLGLSIVKSLAEAHGGSVSVSSPGEGRGATFVVRVPCAGPAGTSEAADDAPDVESAGTDPTPIGPRLAGVRILLVEDDPDSGDIARRLLTEQGALVRLVASARAAMAAFDEFRPEVLLSDIGMPDIDGYQLMEWVRERPPGHGRDIPAAALTALAQPRDRQRALAAGYDAHLPKPIEPNTLINITVRLAARARQTPSDTSPTRN